MKRSLVTLPVLALLAAGVIATSAGAGRATSPGTTESATSEPTGGTASTSAVESSTAESTQPAAAFNDADIAFAQGMIPHHQQAIEMAELALDPTSEASPEVVDLATRIQAAQGPEIELMTGWLEAWGQPLEPATSDAVEIATSEPTQSTADMHMTDTTDGMEMTESTDGMEMTDTSGTDATESTGMGGMTSESDMAALAELTGAEFDEMWLNMMIEHHQGAISMAETEQAEGLNADAIELAGRIIEAQQAEIDEMNDLLAAGTATTELPATTG